MPSRDSDDLQDAPRIVPAKDEIASYRQKHKYSGPSPQEASIKVSSSWGARFMLWILTLAILGGGALAYEFNLRAERAFVSLNQANARIQQLEQSLSLAGESAVESSQSMFGKMKKNESEIAKLWGVAYDHNRKDIKFNKDGVDVLSRKVAVEEKATAKMKKQLAANQSTLDNINKNLRNLNRDFAIINKFSSQLKTLRSDIDKANKLANRVDYNEQSIEAIDAYRLRVNQTLLTLQESLKKLEQAAP